MGQIVVLFFRHFASLLAAWTLLNSEGRGFGWKGFSTAIPRFGLMWGCWEADHDQSIMRCFKGEVFEH
jgi:hypothetical protein